ncbi:scavenger receptor cysteine-rich type 1 protein M130 [Etheostoma spectabile]|uniref:scavenger receptor cysteine-rich type 1 protein M130 n=1 Tax=Etheostoma spectabile TaxID=54343 RepID=UPI0013AFAF73|nr:scavenger receptor cysteine-rich type 1 protein M130-like [Etheostoma spectabile]
MQRWSAGRLAVGLLQSSRGRSMETWRLQCGPKSSSVEAMSLLCWTVTAQIETPALLAKAAGLTCSEPVNFQLAKESSRCAGELEMKKDGEWRNVIDNDFTLNLNAADVVCRHLDCGSAVSTERKEMESYTGMWRISSTCLQSKSAVRECILTNSYPSSSFLKIICSGSVRLVNGTSLCSGRLEVKSTQSTQSWSSVCEEDFDLQDAEVVCRELGCGAPSVLQGALYGDMEAPVWTKEFQCRGHESALLDCDSSDRNTCSSGKAAGLTCSEPDNFQLVRGSSRCAGELEMTKDGERRNVIDNDSAWNLKAADVVCRHLDCGSAVSTGRKEMEWHTRMWRISSTCLQSKSAVRECILSEYYRSNSILEIICSDSVRLVNGTSLCSGRLEVKPTQSTQTWSSVCEENFDLQDAEVVCRELGCGAPSVLQGALYGDMETPVWTKEFQCRGHESALLDCDSSDRNTCSSGKAAGLTCSEPDDVRLSGGASSCAGTPEMKQQGQWRPVVDWDSEWDQKLSSAVCKRLDCGSAVSINISNSSSETPVWGISGSCVQSDWMGRECLSVTSSKTSSRNLEVVCSDLLAQPNISFSTHIDGVSEATQQGLRVLMGSDFTISCSILPQYPGGSFQLIFNTPDPEQKNYTLPAVNHSAHFLFSAADPTHRGEYRCVYHLYVFSHNFSSESRPLHLTLAASVTHLVIRLVVLGLLVLVSAAALFGYVKASRGQTSRPEDKMELDHLGGAEDLLGEEAGGAQGPE